MKTLKSTESYGIFVLNSSHLSRILSHGDDSRKGAFVFCEAEQLENRITNVIRVFYDLRVSTPGAL